MTAEPQDLVRLSRARRLIVEAQTIDEVTEIRDKAQLARGYAKKKGLAQEIVVDASAIKVEAEQKIGQSVSLLRLLGAPIPPHRPPSTAWPTFARPPPKVLTHDQKSICVASVSIS